MRARIAIHLLELTILRSILWRLMWVVGLGFVVITDTVLGSGFGVTSRLEFPTVGPYCTPSFEIQVMTLSRVEMNLSVLSVGTVWVGLGF